MPKGLSWDLLPYQVGLFIFVWRVSIMLMLLIQKQVYVSRIEKRFAALFEVGLSLFVCRLCRSFFGSVSPEKIIRRCTRLLCSFAFVSGLMI